MFDVPVFHAGVDGDHTDMTLVTETYHRNHSKDVQPVVRPRLDRPENINTAVLYSEWEELNTRRHGVPRHIQ